MATPEKYFVSCIKTKKYECDVGKDISEEQLMKLALNKHVNKNRDGEWKSPSEEEKQIVAIRASLEAVKKESLQISNVLKSQNDKGSYKGAPTKDGKTKDKKKRGKGKGNDDPWA